MNRAEEIRKKIAELQAELAEIEPAAKGARLIPDDDLAPELLSILADRRLMKSYSILTGVRASLSKIERGVASLAAGHDALAKNVETVEARVCEIKAAIDRQSKATYEALLRDWSPSSTPVALDSETLASGLARAVERRFAGN